MKDKYSQPKLEAYGQKLAAQLCERHFGPQPNATLDGPAVLRFTPVRQVNLFVVQQLLAKWTAEMAQLRSPYFDFEDAEVRQALTQLMNLLSRRIRLTRETFEPLLARAVTDTLRVAAEPAVGFDEKLLPAQQTVTREQLQEGLRYFDVEKPLFQGFVESLPAGTALDRELLSSRFRLYQQTNFQSMHPMETVVNELSALLPLSEIDLRADEAATPPLAPSPVAAPAPAPRAVPQQPSEPAPVAAKPAPPVSVPPKPAAPAPPIAPAATTPVPVPPAPIPAPVAAPAPAVPPVAATPAAAEVPLYEKLRTEHSSPGLAETLRAERPATASLADKAPKVESLREAISINQRFSFINELFNGENMEYHAAIQKLDALPDAASARRYVQEDLTKQYGWVRKDEHINKLLRLIDRKFE
ncbi:hypothetical protein FY528_09705 [Hymenobacter lutimineralis]|uniref:Uncharacterized protein n=1 Tax=Hymenobacter lutimineralis TaxID=2606448 RepID=A0A5D6V596_9BACT|nr:hypothetical protein [Hymenobacter lutimineralis]TYZ10128.1 hypothetical protein FY528_09705 [Hymenobacter lutimineralis]